MPRAFYNMNDFSGGLNDAVDPRDIGENEISEVNNAVMDKRRSVRPMGGDVAHTEVPSDTAGHITPGYGAFVFGSDHENVPALAPTFGSGKLDFSRAGSNDTITDDPDATLVTLGFQAGDIISITGCTDETGNNLAGLTIKTVTTSTMTLEEDNVLTTQANEAGTVTITRIGGGLDTGEEWLAVMDSKTATVDLYDLKGDSFTAGAIDLGTVTSKSYDADNLAFNDNSGSGAKDTIVSDVGVTTFISSGFRKGDILGISGCDDEDKANNLNAVRVFNVANHTLTLDHSGLLTTDPNESGTPSLTKLTQGVFYFADEALRVADASLGAATEPYWYGFVQRQHFGSLRLTANTRFKNWYSNTNGLAAPTTLAITSGYPSLVSSEAVGFNLTVADVASGGTYENLAYQIAASFIYDGNQESLLYIPTSTTHTPAGNNYALSVSVRATAPFNERVSGARIYIRKDDTDDPWALLMDIDLADGVRAETSGDYAAWTLNSGDQVYVNTVKSLSPSLETYEILNGFSHDEKKITISGAGEGYKTAVVANRRCFVANVKTQNEEGQTVQMRDRLMYTPIGKFDTFPRSFFIDVVKGDAEEFTSLQEFSDRLLAFKNKKMYIINIASPSPANWYVEDIKDFVGVEHPYATTKTEFGIAWCNKFGVYLYDGREVRNILLNRIDETTWQSFFQRDTLIGYNPKKYYLVILKDAFADTGDVYVYDFRTNSWTYGQSAFGDNFNRTNMVPDWNGNMVTVYSNKSTGDLVWNGVNTNWEDLSGGNDWEAVADAYNVKEWSDALRDVAATKFAVVTKDIDFGEPGRKKKVYGVTLTYKSDNDQTQPVYYDTDGGTSFSSQLTGNFSGTGSGWKQVRARPSSPISCQSIRFKILNPSNATGTSEGVQINDLAVEYRPLYTRVS